MPYFALSINYRNMQSIQANNYLVHFNQKAYEALNNHLKENKYSNLFIIVDNETNEYCLCLLYTSDAADDQING